MGLFTNICHQILGQPGGVVAHFREMGLVPVEVGSRLIFGRIKASMRPTQAQNRPQIAPGPHEVHQKVPNRPRNGPLPLGLAQYTPNPPAFAQIGPKSAKQAQISLDETQLDLKKTQIGLRRTKLGPKQIQITIIEAQTGLYHMRFLQTH